MAYPMRPRLPRQESFAAGELDPGLHSAFTHPAYAKGARAVRNWLINKHGVLLNRPGTQKVAAAKYTNKKARLFTFDHSDNQAYALEVGDKYLRAFTSGPDPVSLRSAGIVVGMSNSLRYRSADLAETWTGPYPAPPYPGDGYLYNAMAAKPDGSVILMLGYSPPDKRCRISVNGGETFSVAANAPAEYANAVCWTGTYWVAVGDSGMVAYTPDPDTTPWTNLTVGTADWASVAVEEGTGRLLMGGTLANCTKAQVAYSDDHGETWSAPQDVGAGEAGLNYTGASLNGVTKVGSYWVASVTETAQVKIIRSTDRATWENALVVARPAQTDRTPYINSATAQRNKAALYLLPNKIALSFTYGNAWAAVETPATAAAMRFVADDVLMAFDGAGANSGFYVSRDGGQTWKHVFNWDGAEVPFGVVGIPDTVAEVALPYAEADLSKLRLLQSGDEMLATCQGYSVQKIQRAGTFAEPSFRLAGGFAAAPALRVTGLAVTTVDQTGDADHPIKEWDWVVTWEDHYGVESLPSDPLVLGGSGKAALYPDRPADLAWSAVKEAARYHVYRGRNGERGYVGTTTETTFHDDGGIPILSIPPPKWENPFLLEPPAVAAYVEDRRAFANLSTRPAWIYFSATDEHENYDEQRVKTADSAFRRGLASGRYEEIRALVWLGELLVLTSEAEWQVRGGNAPIAFDNISAKPETYNGCAWVQPLVIGKECLFVQSKGNEIRNLYRGADGWDSDEISMLVGHLFAGRTVVDWAYARRPYGIVWVVLDNGALLTFTFDRKAGVVAWARHDTAGDLFEAVTVVPESGVDVPWFIVKRGNARYIEKLTRRHDLTSAADFCGLDSAVYYNGAPTGTITGLDHLEGRQVYGLADGTVQGPVTVEGGSAVFPGVNAAKWWVGLRITAQISSLDLPEGRTQEKIVGRVFVETSAETLPLHASAGIEVGEDLDNLTRVTFDTARLGILEQVVNTDINPGGRVVVQLTDPVPVEIRGITREVHPQEV